MSKKNGISHEKIDLVTTLRMFSSRRMKTNKVFKDGSQLFIKSSILKNFCSKVIIYRFSQA